MAKSPRYSAPRSAQLSEQQMREAVPRLIQRIKELDELDVSSLEESAFDLALDRQTKKINATLSDIFGRESAEYGEYAVGTLDPTPLIFGGEGYSFREHQENTKGGIATAVNNLRTI